MHTRRNKLTILFFLLLLAGCTKDMPVFIPQALPADIAGTWAFADDHTRYCTIHDVHGGNAVITFPQQLASPIKAPADIPYTYTGTDTVRLSSGTIYPACYFYLYRGNVYGMMQETANAPGQGTYKPIVKITR